MLLYTDLFVLLILSYLPFVTTTFPSQYPWVYVTTIFTINPPFDRHRRFDLYAHGILVVHTYTIGLCHDLISILYLLSTFNLWWVYGCCYLSYSFYYISVLFYGMSLLLLVGYWYIFLYLLRVFVTVHFVRSTFYIWY